MSARAFLSAVSIPVPVVASWPARPRAREDVLDRFTSQEVRRTWVRPAGGGAIPDRSSRRGGHAIHPEVLDKLFEHYDEPSATLGHSDALPGADDAEACHGGALRGRRPTRFSAATDVTSTAFWRSGCGSASRPGSAAAPSGWAAGGIRNSLHAAGVRAKTLLQNLASRSATRIHVMSFGYHRPPSRMGPRAEPGREALPQPLLQNAVEVPSVAAENLVGAVPGERHRDMLPASSAPGRASEWPKSRRGLVIVLEKLSNTSWMDGVTTSS